MKSGLGFDHNGPNEFEVIPLAPLSMPNGYDQTPSKEKQQTASKSRRASEESVKATNLLINAENSPNIVVDYENPMFDEEKDDAHNKRQKKDAQRKREEEIAKEKARREKLQAEEELNRRIKEVEKETELLRQRVKEAEVIAQKAAEQKAAEVAAAITKQVAEQRAAEAVATRAAEQRAAEAAAAAVATRAAEQRAAGAAAVAVAKQVPEQQAGTLATTKLGATQQVAEVSAQSKRSKARHADKVATVTSTLSLNDCGPSNQANTSDYSTLGSHSSGTPVPAATQMPNEKTENNKIFRAAVDEVEYKNVAQTSESRVQKVLTKEEQEELEFENAMEKSRLEEEAREKELLKHDRKRKKVIKVQPAPVKKTVTVVASPSPQWTTVSERQILESKNLIKKVQRIPEPQIVQRKEEPQPEPVGEPLPPVIQILEENLDPHQDKNARASASTRIGNDFASTPSSVPVSAQISAVSASSSASSRSTALAQPSLGSLASSSYGSAASKGANKKARNIKSFPDKKLGATSGAQNVADKELKDRARLLAPKVRDLLGNGSSGGQVDGVKKTPPYSAPQPSVSKNPPPPVRTTNVTKKKVRPNRRVRRRVKNKRRPVVRQTKLLKK
ncbi:MAG: hypothetical protein LBQ43_01290 [Holosporales bacterium]|nr:hypothetical protein [Holosporales bacterium]